MPSIRVYWHDHFGNRVQSRDNYFLLRLFSILFSGVFTVNEVLRDWAKKKLMVEKVEFLSNFTSDSSQELPVTFLNGSPEKGWFF